MGRVSRRFTSALGASAAIHVIGSIAFWQLYARDEIDRSAALVVEAPPLSVATDNLTIAVTSGAMVDVAVVAAPRTALSLTSAAVAGDTVRDVASASAPSTAPNPDPLADLAAASSGSGRGLRAVSLTGRRDSDELRAQLYNNDDRYQLQRIRTGDARTSREDVRATPNPGFTPELASHSGDGRSRVLPGANSVGRVDGGQASIAHSGLSAGDGSDRDHRARAVAAEARGGARIGKDGEEAEGFSRPLIARGPAATDGSTPSASVTDRSDSAMASNERRPGRLELSHPGFMGPGDSGRGSGSLPAWAANGRGTEAVPSGDPNAPSGEELALATYRRHYNEYLSEIKRRVDPLWELPHEIALQLEQGDVFVTYTIRRDGTLKNVKVVKTSGWKSFDRVVVAAIRRAAPFRPLPSVFGDELQITSHFDGANPVVR